MGIKKDIDTDYNVPAGFWKCVANNYCGNGRYEIIVEGWKNKASFAGRFLPLKRRIFFSDAELTTKQAVEQFILAQPEFAGGIEEAE